MKKEANGDHANFVESHATTPLPKGNILDESGRILGQHDGVHHFTVGQRKGLRIASSSRLYVTSIDAISRSVTVGNRKDLEESTLTASAVNWIGGAPPKTPLQVTAQIRHRHAEAAAVVHAQEGGRAVVRFDNPQLSVTPGQAVVFYDADEVLGGGWID